MNQNIYKLLILIAIYTVAMTSCEDFLDKTSPSKIQADEWFYNESSLEIYANGFIDSYTPSVASLTYGDADADYVARINQSSFYTGSWTPNDQAGWSISNWKPIYNVNYFLKHLRETPGVSEEILNHYEGVGRFWRAWHYFSFVKNFGAVPWYSEPIDPEDDGMLYKTRDSREYVMHMILEDLNYASKNCLVTDKYVNHGVINGYIANALKARICLYEGTYRKYHSVEPSCQKAWSTEFESADDFLNECVAACQFIMDSKVYSIKNNASNVNTQYRKIFNSEAVNYDEILWAREYIEGVVMHPTTWYFNSATSGSCWSMTKDFLNTYLNRDGSRYTDDASYKTNSYCEELNPNRDARIAQTIITPTYAKLQGGKMSEAVPNFNVTKTGYQIIKFNIDDSSLESTTTSYNSIPVMRYAEVLLNYAEAKAELGQFTEDDWKATIALLRARAGVSAIAPTEADPYLVSYFDNTVTDKWLLEIRRERGTELFMENLRYQDLMRWHLGHLIERAWRGVYCPVGTVQPLNGSSTKFISIVKNPVAAQANTQYIVLSDNKYVSVDSDGCLVFEQTPRVWKEKMYLKPIPQSAIDVNQNLAQNELWK